MAPLPLYLTFPRLLLFSLFVLSAALITSSLSVSISFDAQNQLPQLPTTQILLGRRSLLAKSVKDVEDDEEDAPPLPKKKKVLKTYKDEDDEEGLALPNKKKKSSSSSSKDEDDVEVEVPPKKKKKKTSSSFEGEDEVVSPKKKNSSSSFKDEADEEVSPKEKISSSFKDEEAEGVSTKKKKSPTSTKEEEDEEASSKKKKSDKDAKLIKPNTSSSKNQTKLLKPGGSSKDQTKLTKPIGAPGSSKNKTKLIKTTSKGAEDDSTSSSKSSSTTLTKAKLKKLNSTSTKSSTNTKSLDLIKSTAKDKTKLTKSKSQSTDKSDTTTAAKKKQQKAPPSPASWIYQDDSDNDDLVSEFRDLPTKFQQTFIPDLHRISTTSKIYLTKANKEMTRGFKPYVGNKYAPSVATGMSFAFILVPLLLVSLIFNKIKAYFSLQRLLIFIQIYLAIYFSTLCLSSLLTGLEPLRFFYATSRNTYVWLQVLQTLGYVLYLLLLLMYLILVFSTESPLGQKFLGLAQTFVGFAVGLHYYMTVFHRVVLRQPPKTNWKVHGIYATCFLLICLSAQFERRKKAYLAEGGEEGKKS